MVEAIRLYVLIVGMWIRASMAYRASFVMLALGQFLLTGLDFVAIFIMFWHADRIGGFALPEVAFLYATSAFALGMADLLLGNIEQIGQRIRTGTFDVILIRPVPTLVQVAADQFALRRIGRISQAVAVLLWALWTLEVTWTWDRIALLPVMLVAGSVIFGAVFVLTATFQFVANGAAEVGNAFTYGGNALTRYPPTIFARDLVRGVTFVVPLAFINWMPAMHVLDREDPLHLPEAARFASPAVAVAMTVVAGLVWRAGVRSYRSTGS